MGLFRTNKRRNVASLLTGTVGPAKGGWRVDWWGDGAVPPSVTAGSLTEATDQAGLAAAVLYASSEPMPEAELQLAIYPWDYAKGAPMFDISGGPGHFVAQDIQSSELAVEGASLEDLVALVGQMPDGKRSMFRWVRRVSELPTT